LKEIRSIQKIQKWLNFLITSREMTVSIFQVML
jgi:hypothetical protein